MTIKIGITDVENLLKSTSREEALNIIGFLMGFHGKMEQEVYNSFIDDQTIKLLYSKKIKIRNKEMEETKVYNTTTKSDDITAYFFNKLNVDDLYTQEEFKEMSEEVQSILDISEDCGNCGKADCLNCKI